MTPSLGIEKRRFGRRVVCKKATIVQYPAKRYAAVVVDISVGGARVQTENAAELAEEFLLIIPEDDIIHPCRIAHRQRNAVGVQFTRLSRRLSRVKSKFSKSEPDEPHWRQSLSVTCDREKGAAFAKDNLSVALEAFISSLTPSDCACRISAERV